MDNETKSEVKRQMEDVPLQLAQAEFALMLARHSILGVSNTNPGQISDEHMATLTRVDDHLRRAVAAMTKLKLSVYADLKQSAHV